MFFNSGAGGWRTYLRLNSIEKNIYLFYNVYIVLTHLSFIIINIDKEIRGKRKPNKKTYKYF